MTEHSSPFGDLPSRLPNSAAVAAKSDTPAEPLDVRPASRDEDVIRIDDLAPREDVTGGRKLFRE